MTKLSYLAEGHDFRFMRAFVMAPHFAWLELCLARRNSGGAQGIKKIYQAKSFQLKLSPPEGFGKFSDTDPCFTSCCKEDV